mgnify:CR=1 FL=1|jgi:hypothetical protein
MWQNLVSRATELLRRDDDPSGELIDNVDSARRQWLSTKSYFDSVTDPDLIDHAIYAMTAAERRYIYLLRAAQEKGVKISLTPQ